MSLQFPLLETERLRLREFREGDIPAIQRLAAAREVAEGTWMPHPYEEGMAAEFITRSAENFEAGSAVNFAITLKTSDEFIGSIGLTISSLHQTGALGYWLGVPYWGKGYCTEAGRAALNHAFTVLKLRRVSAPHFHTNPASGAVMRKLGMTWEGTKRGEYLRFGEVRDAVLYGVLAEEFFAQRHTDGAAAAV